MTGFDLYVFFLCFIVFTLLTVLLGGMLIAIIKLTVRLIRAGLEDEKIKTEYLKAKAKKRKCGCFDCIVSFILSAVLLAFFGFSVFVNLSQNASFENIPTMRVVNSASMAKKHKDNTYLAENNLNDQFNTFDLIFTYKLPKEEDIELYDIVVYEVDEILVIHRVVGIEEPNSSHPNTRYFLCQGDAVETPDRFPVLYSQMRAVYRGQRVPFIGSFISFMQSPAGWLCVMLIVASLIGSPLLQRKVNREKMRRLIEIGFINEDGSLYEPSPFAHLKGRTNSKTFDEALAQSDDAMKDRHAQIVELLSRFDGIRVIEGRARRTYKCGNTPIVRLAFRGKTLNTFISLTPADYADTKYVFEDYSKSKDYKLYPMRMKQSSERQTRWTLELLLELAEKNGITVNDKAMEIPVESENAEIKNEFNPFAHLTGRVNNMTFRERLDMAGGAVKERPDRIEELLSRFEGIRVIEARKQETYKCKNTPVARLTMRGKTLNVYLALPTADFADSKYIFTDASHSKRFALYPMRIKVSSERQTRWTLELLMELAKRNGITVNERAMPIPVELAPEMAEKTSPFAHLEGREDNRTFDEMLSHTSKEMRERYESIAGLLNAAKGIRLISAKKQQTYKYKNTPIARLAIRGKTLNAYLALDPKAYENTKYVFKDMSASKKFARYPMRIRVTSERQRRWTVELINKLAEENGIERSEVEK